jgi:hypothetical protein
MSEPHPRHVEGLEAHEVDDGLVVYDAAADRVHHLNATASIVFELCTGDHTDAEIEALVAAAWHLPEPAHDSVRGCLAQLRTEGVIV